MNRQEHWEKVYQTKGQNEVSWFREHLETSLQMIANSHVRRDAAIIDVGGGNSTLVGDLLAAGYVDLSVLDISAKAIADSKERLRENAGRVNWLVDDITAASLTADHFDVWHDRAVFHFLTSEKDRRKYVDLVLRALKRGGHIIVASFGVDGPQKCSGLDVVRYSPETMHDEFGSDFQLVESVGEVHATPFGTTQDFVYCYCRKL